MPLRPVGVIRHWGDGGNFLRAFSHGRMAVKAVRAPPHHLPAALRCAPPA